MVANSVATLFALDREKWRGGGREGRREGGREEDSRVTR